MRLPVALLLAGALLTGCGGDGGSADAARPPADTQGRPAIEKPRELPPAELGARLLRRTALRQAPRAEARVLVDARTRTDFGNTTVLYVDERRDGWARVHHPELGNGERAWVAERDVEFVREPWAIEVDLSDRRAEVFLHGEVIDRFRVGVGRSGSDTPTGTFAVTDLIRTEGASAYGCCILALTGHQPSLPAGWIGGDRLALHGTPDESSVGAARSAGCIRLRERDLRRLLRRIRLGSRVTIRA